MSYIDERREAYGLRFGLPQRKWRYLDLCLMNQLDRCLSDEARRILLGISR